MHTPDDFVHAERFYAAVMMASCVCLVLARMAKTSPALVIKAYSEAPDVEHFKLRSLTVILIEADGRDDA